MGNFKPPGKDDYVNFYVDDGICSAKTEQECTELTLALLKFLAEKGIKIERSKCKLVRQRVDFLKTIISNKGFRCTSDRIDKIKSFPKPVTVRDMMSFKALTSYIRSYIPAYTSITAPLGDMIKEKGYTNLKAKLNWTEEREKTFSDIKELMANAQFLHHIDRTMPIRLELSIDDKGSYTAALYQTRPGLAPLVCHYYSSSLKGSELNQTKCARFITALRKTLMATAHIILNSKTIVMSQHDVYSLIQGHLFAKTADLTEMSRQLLLKSSISYGKTGQISYRFLWMALNMSVKPSTTGN